jgi:hypothetical protein
VHTRVGLPGATIDLTNLSAPAAPYLERATAIPAAFARGMAAIASTRPLSDKGVVTRSINDLLTYPAAAIPTAYQAVTHPGQLASGIVDQVTHPGQTFREHPLFGALLLHGGVSALGRSAGAVARSGALGADLRAAAGTSRPMIGLAGESGARLRTPRAYSKDVIRKAGQVAYDKALTPIKDRQGNVVTDARGRPVLAAPERGPLAPLNRPSRLLRKRADFIASRRSAAVRDARAQASREVLRNQPTRGGGRVAQAIDRSLVSQPGKARILPKALYRPEKDVVAMAMQGTLRSPETFMEDLVKERARLEHAYDAAKHGEIEMDPVERKTNRMQARTIDRVLNDPKALRNAGGVFQSARVLSQVGNELTRRAVEARILHPDAAERARLFPYAQSHMGAAPAEHADGKVTLRAGDGTFLSNEQIHAHMQASGIDPQHIAYLPHRGDVRGARAYYQQFQPGRRPNLDQESRTGAAYSKGAIDTTFHLPLEHITRSLTTLASVKEFDRMIHDVGVKHPSGDYFTWDEAKRYAKFGGHAPNEATAQRLPGEPELVPVRALPAKYDEARAQDVQNMQNPEIPGHADQLVQDQTSRLTGPDPADPHARNVVLVPREIQDRLLKNLTPTNEFSKSFQAATSAFRRTVLPFSTRWLTGNVVEAMLRLSVAGVSPHDPLIGRKLIDTMDPVEANQVLSHLVGGLLYGEKGLTNYRTGQDFAGNLGGAVAASAPGRAGGKAIRGVTDPVFAFNRALEREAQYAALGKYARRQMQEMTGSWFKAMRAQEQALKDVAAGLKDTGAQQDAARFLDDTLGKYSRFSPKMRAVIQGYAPFLPWYLAAAKWTLHTLPVHHPVKLAVLTQAEAAFQSDWQAQHRDVKVKAPGLMTAIPTKGGGFVDAARYTPFGLTGPLAAGDPSAAAGVVLPQVSGVQLAALGLDPFGRPLQVPKTAKNPSGKVPLIPYAVNQAAESFVPGLAIARRLREHGETALPTSTALHPQTKPGTSHGMGAGYRTLYPFRSTYLHAAAANGVAALPPAERRAVQRELDHAASSGQGQVSPQEAAMIQREIDLAAKGR